MQKNITFFLLLFFMSAVSPCFGQIGKFLKEKARNMASEENLEKLKNVAGDKLEEERAELDSTSFNFAISINDNADFYETESKRDLMVKWAANWKSREDAGEAEKARRLLDAGELAYARTIYKRAGMLFREAKRKYEDAGLTDDPNYYKTISNIGLLLSTMGRYTMAEDFTKQALDLRSEAFGEQSSGYGASLNNLAVLQKETGRYNEAEKNIAHVIDILKNTDGDESMTVAIAMNNQAMIYQAMGRFEQAEEVLNKAISISETLQSKKSHNHQKFMTNLALLSQEMGKYSDAEFIFTRLIALKKRRMGEKHPDYAHMLSNLAALYVEMDKTEKVEELLKEAIKIYDAEFGRQHRLFAGGVSDLGNFYRYMGRYEEAKPLLIKAAEIRARVLGENHPAYVESQEDLAILHWKMGSIQDAKQLYFTVLDKSLEFINNYFAPMSEAEKTKYWDKLRPRFERFYSFATDVSGSDNEIIGHVYDYHIATKGLLLYATSKIKKQILASGDEALISEYIEWLDQKETLAKYYSYSKEELEDENINLDSIERATNNTEKSLSQRSDVFSAGYQYKQVSHQDLIGKLGVGEAAIEFLRIRKFENKFTDEVNYLVMVLKKGLTSPDHIVLVNGKDLEGRYFKYYNNVIHQKMEDEYSYQQYWQPLELNLTGVNRLYLSLDGIYNQINPNTFKNESGFLINRYDLIVLGNTKDLVEKRSTGAASKDAYLLGNPEFGGTAVSALPGTKLEIANIAKMLKQKAYKLHQFTESNASEQNLKKVDNPRILHLATHGYFLQDHDLNKEKVFGISVESARDNPLLRAGLLLAGSGKVLDMESSSSLESEDNGILTAYEAINLNLENTDLVILSACETAVGDVKAGEGVYGLQRAFLGAGADNMIMSLWKVSDDATQELMTNFYKNWLLTGDKQKAFKQAQIELKSKYPHPYYWGAFVMIGS